MDEVLESCREFSAPYLDDVVIFSNTWEDHLKNLRRVVDVLGEAGLKREKCNFGKAGLEYLGHMVGGGKVVVPAHRVGQLRTYKQPTTKKEIDAFIGFIIGNLYQILQNSPPSSNLRSQRRFRQR